jgi:protein SCO1/2
MTHPTRSRRRRRALTGLASLAGTAMLLSACGGGGDDTLVGYRIEPLRNVAEFTVEAASAGNEPFPIRADPGRLLVVFLGFTNCPDACPTALAEVRRAIDRLGADAEPVDVAMLTVDPTRDTPDVHTAYIRNFDDNGIALRTEDTVELRQIADAFGATYDTTHDHAGVTTDVGHTDQTYLVDSNGDIIVTWTADMTNDDLEHDLRIVLDDLHQGTTP